jgi:hypothetical protein
MLFPRTLQERLNPRCFHIFSFQSKEKHDGNHSIAVTNSALTYDVFDFRKLVTEAYDQVFTEANIKRHCDRLGYGPLIHKCS